MTMNWGTPPAIPIDLGTPPRLEGHLTADDLTGHVTLDKVTGEIGLKYDGPTEFTHKFRDTEFTIKYTGDPIPMEYKGGPLPINISTGDLDVNLPDLYRKLMDEAEGKGYEKGKFDALLYAFNKENMIHALESLYREAAENTRDVPEYTIKAMRDMADALPGILQNLARNFSVYGRGGME